MDVVCVGGGPAGLYFALLMKKTNAKHRVRVVERNRPQDTFGWGTVFSDATLEQLRGADASSHDGITANFMHWDDVEIRRSGRVTRSRGHGFAGIARARLLDLLAGRALALGVELEYGRDVRDLDAFADADLVVACDGANSGIRAAYAGHFRPQLDVRACRYVWLASTACLDAFTFVFEQTDQGWFTAHAYPFGPGTSTWIIECRAETWLAHGLDRASTHATLAFCEELFARHLRGHTFTSNGTNLRGQDWQKFTRVSTQKWRHGNIVLLGDAARTAHFSIGSGTKLAMEDAIALQRALCEERSTPEALDRYERERRGEVLRLQNAARNSMEWFENVARYAQMPEEQFNYSLLTRSQRVGHENLRMRDSAYVERFERWFSGIQKPPPPMFTPLRLRDLELPNRVVVSPMDTYSAVDGTPNDFHLVHLGSRAMGGAGLVYSEMTCVSRNGRITPGCAGMYQPEHVAAWKRIVAYVHVWTNAKICLQLGHSGPKGSTKRMWEGADEPLDDGNWPVIEPSEMTRTQMEEVREEFVRATRMGIEAGFDVLELHCAHGYLLSAFITPLQNTRADAYGGSLENRLRYPLEVFAAMREVWPQERPMSVRISATDWVDGGITGDDAVEIARAFKAAGADLIDASTGLTSREAKPVYGRMYQTPYADRIRNEVGIATMAVGNIDDADQVNSIIAAGRADLCALGRPHLADPYWTLHAAAQQRYSAMPWPMQYLPGKAQLERSHDRR